MYDVEFENDISYALDCDNSYSSDDLTLDLNLNTTVIMTGAVLGMTYGAIKFGSEEISSLGKTPTESALAGGYLGFVAGGITSGAIVAAKDSYPCIIEEARRIGQSIKEFREDLKEDGIHIKFH